MGRKKVDNNIVNSLDSRSVPLPTRVEHDKAEAAFEQGILTVTLPKTAEAKPKTIKVKARPVIEGKS